MPASKTYTNLSLGPSSRVWAVPSVCSLKGPKAGCLQGGGDAEGWETQSRRPLCMKGDHSWCRTKLGMGRERMGSRPEPPCVYSPQTSHILRLCPDITTLRIPLPCPVRLVIKHKEQNNHCWRPNYGEQPGSAVYRLCFGGNVLIYALSNI